MKTRLTKTLRFVAAHQLAAPGWDESKNIAVFGKCANLHGHDYVVEATVEGHPDSTGFVMNLTDLKAIMKDKIIDPFDHSFLNDTWAFQDVPTTVENMARIFFEMLDEEISGDGVRLESVTVHESPGNKCEVSR